MTLKLQVTTAGRAALVNAQNTGTLPVTVAAIGVTDQVFAPDATLTALPGQIKQLATFAGSAVAADTIHVTIRDDSADTYSLRGFGLFLADGTLFGVYGQADAILEKSAQAMMLLATDVIFADIDAASLIFGDTQFLNPPATTEVQGVVELATDAESITGADSIRAVTPKSLLAVLNDRFGAGNPSSFVKTLLDKVSALAFVTALGIRGAASYDTGTGNGLDADLLDGQHGAYYRAWGNLTGVPGTFTPSAHQHSAADIISGTLAVARGGTGAGTFVAGNYLVGNGTGALGSKTPADVLADIGAAPVVHSHAISAVNGLQGALDAKAPMLSPALSGTPTAPTAAAGANNTQIANTAFVQQVIANVINGSPGALDTLKELADAMGDDPNFAATVTNALAGKAGLSSNNTMTGANSFYGASAFAVDGDNDSRVTFKVGGGRRGLVSVNAGLGVASFVMYAPDGGTPLGQLDIGTGGMKYTGDVTFTCGVGGSVKIVAPGSSAAGSFVQFSSPGGNPGISGQYATTKRRDIIFSDIGLQIAVSGNTSAAGSQFTFAEDGNFTAVGLKVGNYDVWHEGNFNPATKANLASPALTGTPTAPTAAGGTNNTQLATTAFVQAAVAPRAPLASPALSGVPTAPTAAAGTNSTQLATTAFVQAAIAAALANYLPKNNPTFTGTMTGPAYNET